MASLPHEATLACANANAYPAEGMPPQRNAHPPLRRGPKARIDITQETPIALRVKELLVESGCVSNRDFAMLCGIDEGSVRHLWRGGEPRARTLELIAEACDVRLDWLVSGLGKKRPRPRIRLIP